MFFHEATTAEFYIQVKETEFSNNSNKNTLSLLTTPQGYPFIQTVL